MHLRLVDVYGFAGAIHLEKMMSSQKLPPTSQNGDDMQDNEGREPYLDPKIQDVIGKALRTYSADIVAAPIPDSFMDLLARLEAKELEDK